MTDVQATANLIHAIQHAIDLADRARNTLAAALLTQALAAAAGR